MTTATTGMVKVKCVVQKCGATFYALASADRVKCTVCHTEWPWKKQGKLLMQRGAGK
jgi:hypothetical protein